MEGRGERERARASVDGFGGRHHSAEGDVLDRLKSPRSCATSTCGMSLRRHGRPLRSDAQIAQDYGLVAVSYPR